jgi:predicted negative regulator of RcsB-dependent stress response
MLGNLPRSHELTQQLHEQVVLIGLEHSDHQLTILDMQEDIYLAKTEYLEAKKICETALSNTSIRRSPRFYAHFLVQNACSGIRIGRNMGEILGSLEAAEEIYRGLVGPRILLCSWVRAELELHQGHLQSACAGFQESLSKSLGVYPDIPVFCLAALGDPRHKMDTAWNTLHWAMIYLALVRKMKDLVASLQALRRLADLFVLFNDEETALNLFHTALKGATNIDIHQLRAECMAGIGDIMSRRGNTVEAKEMWEAAIPLFIRSSQTKDAATIEAHLAKLTLAQDHQEVRSDYPVVVTDSQATTNQEESRRLTQLTHLSVAQNSPPTVVEGSMQSRSANDLENATGELNCTIQYPFCS